MKEKLIYSLKVILCLIVIMALLMSIITSQNNAHIESCHDDHCTLCQIINLAKILISITLVICIILVQGFMIFYILSRISKTKKVFAFNSLIFQCVQFNE